MSDDRTNKVIAVLGGRNAGKTTFMKNLMNDVYKDKKILVCDTVDHPAYRDLPEIDINKIKYFKSGWARIFAHHPAAIMQAVHDQFYNGVVICEDARKYVKHKMKEEVENFIIDTKQKNADMFFLFHSFRATPIALWDYLDYLTLLKVKGPPTKGMKSEVAEYDNINNLYIHIMKQAKTVDYPNITIELNS